jgi:hypothetical protein
VHLPQYVVDRRDYYLQLQPAPISSTSPIRGLPLPATRTYVLRARAGRPAGRRPPRRAFVRTAGVPPAGWSRASARRGRALYSRGCRRRDDVRMVGWCSGAASSRADDADMSRPPRALHGRACRSLDSAKHIYDEYACKDINLQNIYNLSKRRHDEQVFF